MNDQYYMQVALRLAKRGLGSTSPNPAVGCVIVKNHSIIGQGVTGKGGRPHAEVLALNMAGAEAKDSTVYSTLEPCCHYGKTAPCTDVLIAAGVKRVVVAVKDTDKRVSGHGVAQLQSAGIEVTEGICAAEARELNAGFFSVVEKGRPLVTLKLATTLDGKIATSSGESKWITGETARHYGHLLRAQHDAIMVGVQTVISDDPDLSCRLPGLEDRSPIRIIMDSHLRTPSKCTMVTTAKETPTWIMTGSEKPYGDAAVEVLKTKIDNSGRIDASEALKLLAERGITRLMLEGGGTLASSLLKAGLVDNIVWFRAASVIGNDGISAVGNLNLQHLAESCRFTRQSVQLCGGDVVETLKATS